METMAGMMNWYGDGPGIGVMGAAVSAGYTEAEKMKKTEELEAIQARRRTWDRLQAIANFAERYYLASTQGGMTYTHEQCWQVATEWWDMLQGYREAVTANGEQN